jgi:hypothetical protein
MNEIITIKWIEYPHSIMLKPILFDLLINLKDINEIYQIDENTEINCYCFNKILFNFKYYLDLNTDTIK